MSETIIRQVSGVSVRPVVSIQWTTRPFKRFGVVPVGGRSTAIKLRSGDVWVLASTTLDAPTKSAVDGMGKVKYIVAPDTEHNQFLGEFKQAYPDAKLIGVEPLVAKRKDLQFDGAYGMDPPGTKYGYEPEIEACYFPETVNNDVAFFHAESRSLIEADLLWNMKTPLGTFGPDSALHKKFVQMTTSNKGATGQYARRVAEWDFDMIIPCHGEVIESDGKSAWKSAFEAFFQ